jgi:hypothetical protein
MLREFAVGDPSHGLPGSKKAAVENLEAILPAIPHAVKMLRNETAHPESDTGRIVTIQNAEAPTLVVVSEGGE